MSEDKEYVMVTTVSSHRIRYVVPYEKFMADDFTQKLRDGKFEEFAQVHLGEQFIEAHGIDLETALEVFDVENDYLKEWSEDQKKNFILRNARPSFEENLKAAQDTWEYWENE